MKTSLTVIVLALIAAAGAFADDWPQFRGIERDGVSREAVLDTWPEKGPKELWRRSIGEGFSGMAVVGDRLYTMEAETRGDKQVESAVAIDVKSGKTIWATVVGEWQELVKLASNEMDVEVQPASVLP